MKTLIFDTALFGHHIEYIHHIYMAAGKDLRNDYVFAVPRQQWRELKDKLEWADYSNISWHFLDDSACIYVDKGNMLMRCWKNSRLAVRTMRATCADRLILISLAQYVPFLPLMMPRGTTLRGIVYKIYLRSNKSAIARMLDWFRYKLLARSCHVDRVFILNDAISASRLCEIFKSPRFCCLPDPVPNVNIRTLQNIRHQYAIGEEQNLFLHFGAMGHRKGSLVLLRALTLLPNECKRSSVFVFAGKVDNSIKDEFYALVDMAQQSGVNIKLMDEFCSFEKLNNLCHSCDCILIPYLTTNLSSGAIGYAALHAKPVIGPSTGLIGELIANNKLGDTITEVTPETLSSKICLFQRHSIVSDYQLKNSIDSFSSLILK